MKKLLLHSIIIAIVFFFWQFVSWAAGNFHGEAQKYTPKQDTIQSLLNGIQLDEGRYMIPSVAPGTPMDKANEEWESYMGKPWMFVTYYGPHEMSMSVNMIRGFLADWVFGLILAFILLKVGKANILDSLKVTLGIGILGFISVSYTNHIWYPTFDLWPTFLDAIVPFAIIGILNGWRWNKNNS